MSASAGVYINPSTGDVSTGNLGMFKNRIINGDMRIDQRNSGVTGAGGLAGSYLTYKTSPSSFYTVDRFAVASPDIGALTAKQISLTSNDIATVGGTFTNAVAVGLVPTDSLAVYLPFDGNTNDASGNNVTVTPVGSMQYVTANVIGTNALYLANEGNVIATSTKATNRLTTTYTSLTASMSVSFWMLMTKTPLSGQFSTIFGYGTSSVESFVMQASYSSTSSCTLNANAGTGTTTTSININTWYHVVAVWVPSTSVTFYLNGSLVGTSTTTIPGMLSNSTLVLGDHVRTDLNRPFAGFIDDFRVYNRALSATEIAALATNVGIPIAPATTSWATRLTFDNTTADAQGTLPTPALTGSPVYTPVCKTGTAALDLTANIAGGTATNAVTYTLASGAYSLPLTMTGWFNASLMPGAGTGSAIITIGNNTNTYSFSVQTWLRSTSKIAFGVYVGSWITIETSFSVNLGTWYHVALTVTTSSYLNAYVNGILAASYPIPSGTLGLLNGSGTINQLRIGADTGTSLLDAFRGLVDDVRVYNRVLTSQEVTGLYASSQYSAYSLFQQTIEGNNLADLGWGTSAAQPVTASMWIKNNSSNAQQFSIAANNTGMLAWIDFEGSSYADKLSLLTNATLTGTGSLSTSIYKVGTTALNLTANNSVIGGNATTYITYNADNLIKVPLTVSTWIYVPTVSVAQTILSIGNALIQGNGPLNIAISSTGYIQGSANNYSSSGGTNTSVLVTSSVAIAASTWYHIGLTIQNGGSMIVYINGTNVGSTTIPNDAIIMAGSSIYYASQLRLGGACGSATQNVTGAYSGYIDDVRIYNRALSATQVAQLYANNANSTTSSSYLIPRSLVYNTPVIPANTWQKVSVTIPGDTTGSWMTNSDAGLTLSLCLGSTGLYNTNNVTTSTNNNAITLWNNTPEYMGSNVQLYCNSENNLLASITNSVYVTGVQLEKGMVMTPYEFRPIGMEMQLCQRYYQRFVNKSLNMLLFLIRMYSTGAGSGIYYYISFLTLMRIEPIFTRIGTWTLFNVASQPITSTYGGVSEYGIQLHSTTTSSGDAYFCAPVNTGFDVSAEF